ncbi:PIN domain-containing protein [Paracoccus chinensis]|uniref:PIN domain-containing protein n=1 Tax=Paracoccus chinensis TaxID=525640 RepID=A0A1G9JF33_9RHOB|nr:PIN domain-containing protein [Paracoccus chinensis]SDL36170.1 PIN domain-containing protein [Paracoccus chinensis]
MSFHANPFCVVLDANVLYPFRVRDILLQFAMDGLFRARWTDTILEEWQRTLINNRPEFEASVRQQLEILHSRFPESFVIGYEPLIGALELPDADDRHVLAAAIKCGAQHIVTENLRDFPADVLEQYDVEPVSADDFLHSTFELFPFAALRSLRTVRLRYKNPSYSASAFITDLTAKGMPKLAATLRDHIEFI